MAGDGCGGRLTRMYFGGAGKIGVKPMGWENTAASLPSVLLLRSPSTDSVSGEVSGAFFFVPIMRLRNDTPFLTNPPLQVSLA